MILNEPLVFSVPGQPQGKGRARSFRHAGGIGHYTPEKTRSYESLIQGAAIDEMRGREPSPEPVEVTIRAVFAIPRSFSKKRREAALRHEILPARKPDMSNIAKAVEDAMNGVVFCDDCQIVRETMIKVYGPSPQVVIEVTPILFRHYALDKVMLGPYRKG